MATKYLRGAGTGSWNTDASWSTTSSAGAANTTKPVAADAVILDTGSGTVCTVDVGNQACTSIVCTGYTGALTFTTLNLTTTGTVTLATGMTINVGTTAVWNMGCSAVAFTPAGKTLGNLNFSVTGTLTITGGNAACSGVLSVATGVTVTLASNDISTSGGITVTGTGIINGTGRTINLSGGTWSGTSTGSIQTNLTITNGVIVSGNVYYGGQTINTSGATGTSSTGTVFINANSTLTDSNSGTPYWAVLGLSSATNITLVLSQDTKVLNLSASAASFTISTNNLTVKSSIDTKATGAISGSITITMDGTGASPTWLSTGWTNGSVRTNLTITGAITISGNVAYGTNTLTTSAATIAWASSGTINIGTSTTITDSNSGTPNWNLGNISLNASLTLTLSQVTTILNFAITASVTVLNLATADLTINGNFSLSGGSYIQGRTIIMTGVSGSALLQGTGAGGRIASGFTFLGGANTITISNNGLNICLGGGGATVLYTSGNIVTTGSQINIYGTIILNTNGMSWNNITTFTGVTATMTLASAFTCVGIFTIGVNTTFSGSYLPTVGSISGNFTLTLSNNMTCTGNYTNTAASFVTGAFTLSIGGNLTLAFALGGAATINLNGTGSWTANSSTCTLANPLTITGTTTISGNVYYLTGTINTSVGTVIWSSAIFNVSGACTLTDSNSGTPNWAGATINGPAGAGTITLSQITTIQNVTAATANGVSFGFTSNGVIVTGNITVNGTGTIGGTGTITMTGATAGATWSHPSWNVGGGLFNTLIFLGGANTITISGNVGYAQRTITYTSGNVVTTGSTLHNITGYVIWNLTTSGMSWNNISIGVTLTITLGNALTCLGTLTTSVAVSFVGSYLVTVGSISQGANLALSNNTTCTGNYTNTAICQLNGAFVLSVGGNLTLAYALSGAASITMNGTGTWTASSSTCTLSNALTFAGTITITGNVYYNNAVMTWASGTVNASGDTIYFNINCSIVGASHITFGAVVVPKSVAITADSSMTCTDLNMYYLSQLTMVSGGTLTVSNSMLLDSCTLLSGTPSSPCYLTYNGTSANNKSAYINATDVQAINAINVWNAGTLLRTLLINNQVNATTLFVMV